MTNARIAREAHAALLQLDTVCLLAELRGVAAFDLTLGEEEHAAPGSTAHHSRKRSSLAGLPSLRASIVERVSVDQPSTSTSPWMSTPPCARGARGSRAHSIASRDADGQDARRV